MSSSNIISGRRAVFEALSAEKPVEKLIIRIGTKGEIIGKIIAAAKTADIRIDMFPPETFDRKFDPKASGGVVLFTEEVASVTIDDVLSHAEDIHESPFIVVLDGIEDPHNLGAIARSAEGAGCHGLVTSTRRSAPLSSAAVKVSSGALMHLPVAKVTNITETLKYLKKQGVWIFGADMKGEDYREVDYPHEIALVIGAEGRGLSKLTRGVCDKLISIPLKGKVESLNASVSAGILLFHVAGKRE